MNVALLAAVAMIFSDIFEVLKIDADSRNRALLAGVFDSLLWLATISTTAISVTILQGHSLHQKIWVIALVTVANFIGQGTGVLLGKKFIKEQV